MEQFGSDNGYAAALWRILGLEKDSSGRPLQPHGVDDLRILLSQNLASKVAAIILHFKLYDTLAAVFLGQHCRTNLTNSPRCQGSASLDRVGEFLA
jgi:hypothetical protein